LNKFPKPRIENIKFPYRVHTDLNMWVWRVGFVLVFALSITASVSIVIENIGNFVNWLGGLFILVFPFILLKLGPTLIVTEEGLSYREYFFQQKIVWSAIQEIQTTALWARRVRLKGGVCEMDIYHTGTKVSNPIAINVKVFTSDGLVALGEMIAQKASHAKLDEGTENLRKGIMPSLFR